MCIQYYQENTPRFISPAQLNYFRFFENAENEIWSTNPIHSIFADIRINKVYDPLFSETGSTTLLTNIQSNTRDLIFIALDNCGGGFICERNDEICNKRLEETESFLEENFDIIYDEIHANCYYKIYEKTQ